MLLLPVGLVGITSSKDNVSATARHVGGYGARGQPSCLGYDVRFMLMVFGVQYLVRDPLPFETLAEVLRSFN